MNKHLFRRSAIYYVALGVFFCFSTTVFSFEDDLENIGGRLVSDPGIRSEFLSYEEEGLNKDSGVDIEKVDNSHVVYRLGGGSDDYTYSTYDVNSDGKLSPNTDSEALPSSTITLNPKTVPASEVNPINYDTDLVSKAYKYYVEGLRQLKERKDTIDDDEVYVEKLKLGAMSFPVTIDGTSCVVKFFLVSSKIVGRVLVEKEINGKKREVSYCFFSEDNSVDPDLQAFYQRDKAQFLSRQRAQEKRNVVDIQLSGVEDPLALTNPDLDLNNLVSATYSEYHPWYTSVGFKDWYNSVKAPPNVLLGGVCAIWQVGVVGCLGVAHAYLNGSDMSFSDALSQGLESARFGMILSGIYGSVLGIWAGTYRNICTTGKYVMRVIKQSIPSIVYGYLIVINKSGLSILSPIHIAGILLNAHVIVNTVLGKTILDEYYRILRYKVFRGDYHDSGTIKVGKYDTKVEYSNWLFQSIYNFLIFPMKFADLTRVGFTLPTGRFVGLGKIIYYLSGPYVVSYNLKWFRREYINLVKVVNDDTNQQSAVSVENQKLLKKLMVQYDQVEKVWETLHAMWMASAWMVTLPVINMYRALYLDKELDDLKADYELTHDPKTYTQMRRVSTFIQASQRTSEAVKNVLVRPVVRLASKVKSIFTSKIDIDEECTSLFSEGK